MKDRDGETTGRQFSSPQMTEERYTDWYYGIVTHTCQYLKSAEKSVIYGGGFHSSNYAGHCQPQEISHISFQTKSNVRLIATKCSVAACMASKKIAFLSLVVSLLITSRREDTRTQLLEQLASFYRFSCSFPLIRSLALASLVFSGRYQQ